MVERKRRAKPVVVAVVEESKPVILTRFKKLGGGSLYLNNRIIKPGQIFSYDKTKMSNTFLDTLEVVEEGNEVSVKEAIDNAPVVRYEAKKAEDGTYLVTNTKSKKVISTGKLTEAEVNELLKNLNG